MVWAMLLALIAKGGLRLPAFLSDNLWAFISLGSLPLVFCLVLVIGGRKVTSLSRREVAQTFAVHLVRSVTQLSLEFLAWWLSGALPSAAVCLEFVALRMVVTRLPLLPSKDLLFIGVGIEAAGLMDLSAPGVAAVLVIMTAFNQSLDLVLVGLPWLSAQFHGRHSPDRASP
jgi:hypothetical protein